MINQYDLEEIMGAEKGQRASRYLKNRVPYKNIGIDNPVLLERKNIKNLKTWQVAHFEIEMAIKAAKEIIQKINNKKANIQLWSEILEALLILKAQRSIVA